VYILNKVYVYLLYEKVEREIRVSAKAHAERE
jgi:hypothetical protein